MPGLIHIQLLGLGQHRQQGLIGILQRGTDLLHGLGQQTAADPDTDHVPEVLADGAKRHVASALQEAHQGRQSRPDQAGFLQRFRPRRVVHFAALDAAVSDAAMLFDVDRLGQQFDLLERAQLLRNILQRRVAAGRRLIVPDPRFVEFVGREGLAFVSRVTGLAADASFPRTPAFLRTRRLNNIAGGRLRRVA